MLLPRELLSFPTGDNSSDTIVGNVHYNLTTLKHWNYTIYSNGTISNGSLCFLVFEPYTPHLLSNGTYLNSTSCYSPILPLRMRAKLGLLHACFFAISTMFTFINLRKHGRLFLPTQRRFRAIGRRWQWYWALIVAALGMSSGITNVDVDRYYLPELPIVLTSFFWFLMLPATMCVVWESVRHWGSWQERQMIDPDPFALKQDGRRGRVEFWLPLLFYFFFWMNFFMVIPQSWDAVELQRDADQARLRALPWAINARFKAAAFFLLCAWLTTVFSLRHSIKHYKLRNRALIHRVYGTIKYVPVKFMLTIPLSLIMVGYAATCSFDFSISPLNINANLGMVYGLGWGPMAAIILVQELSGYIDPNEDRELIRQRQIRSTEADRATGFTKKPSWWSSLHGNNASMNIHDQVADNVTEIGGGGATAKDLEESINLGNIPVSKNYEDGRSAETDGMAANLLSPTHTTDETRQRFTDHSGPIKGGRNPETARDR